MFECAVCRRAYKTQTSLTRHARNHTEELSSSHTCDLCGTSFARRDILTRHHQVAHVKDSQQRKRCHTACEGCRGARTRCDGGDPCRPCVVASRHCRYSHQGRRVSRPGPSRRNLSPDENEYTEGLAALTPQDSNTSYLPDGTYSNTLQDIGIVLDPFSGIDDPAPAWPTLDLDGLSWPWVHETLFLHDDPSAIGGPSIPSGQQAARRNTTDMLNPVLASIHSGTSTPDMSSALKDEIDLLISHATEVTMNTGGRIGRVDHSEYWSNAASRLKPILGEVHSPSHHNLLSERTRPPHILHRAIIEQYLPKFNRLWPMFLEAEVQPDSLHPILYLVMVSIGSMYGSTIQNQFGMALHKSLRRMLIGSLFELENPEGNLVWMAQARLLTQVQGLYFGQPQGFSYAQHLGAVLVAQARRLELFQPPARLKSTHQSDDQLSSREKLDKWLQSETRNRLAFGILRADVFTSVLLNSRPLLSFEEIDLFTPCSDDVWRDEEGLTVGEKLTAIRVEDRHYAPVMFSDLLRLLLDRREGAPSMRPVSHELCLFGLQAPIWKVSHDPDLFQRLTGDKYVRRPQSILREPDLIPTKKGHQNYEQTGGPADRTATAYDLLSGTLDPSSDALSRASRAMQDMQSDRDRVEDALEKWYNGFQSVRSPQVTQHRDTLMSCMLLWHMSYLRLYAPLHQLHDVSYRSGERQTLNSDLIEQAQTWASDTEACIAASRAVKICDLIHCELERPVEIRASFNFLAFGSLHHAAVVLWTLSEVREDFSFLEKEKKAAHFSGMLGQKNTHGLLKACANLFRMLSPMGGVSFGLAADRLSSVRFPARHVGV